MRNKAFAQAQAHALPSCHRADDSSCDGSMGWNFTLTSAISFRAAFRTRTISCSTKVAFSILRSRGTSATTSTNIKAPARIARISRTARRGCGCIGCDDGDDGDADGRRGWSACTSAFFVEGETLASVSCRNAPTRMDHPCWKISIDTRRPYVKCQFGLLGRPQGNIIEQIRTSNRIEGY